MTTLKQGDLIKNVEGKTCKILGVCGEVVHVSYAGVHNSCATTQTEEKLKEDGYTWDTPAWEPKINDLYWFITSDSNAAFASWNNYEVGNARRDFLGIYQSKELAEAALLETRRKLGK